MITRPLLASNREQFYQVLKFRENGPACRTLGFSWTKEAASADELHLNPPQSAQNVSPPILAPRPTRTSTQTSGPLSSPQNGSPPTLTMGPPKASPRGHHPATVGPPTSVRQRRPRTSARQARPGLPNAWALPISGISITGIKRNTKIGPLKKPRWYSM